MKCLEFLLTGLISSLSSINVMNFWSPNDDISEFQTGNTKRTVTFSVFFAPYCFYNSTNLSVCCIVLCVVERI
jgi:hypothetical protein